jgi:hypothetical protein
VLNSIPKKIKIWTGSTVLSSANGTPLVVSCDVHNAHFLFVCVGYFILFVFVQCHMLNVDYVQN